MGCFPTLQQFVFSPFSIADDQIDDKLDDNDVPFEFTMEGSDSDSEEALLDQPTNRGMLPPSDSESEGDLDDL